jgi:hypothetical protein
MGPKSAQNPPLAACHALLDACSSLLCPSLTTSSIAPSRNTPTGYDSGVPQYSPQEIQRRSELAKQMWADGRLKRRRAKPSSERPRKASELAQSLVEDNRDLIEKSLRETLKAGSTAQKFKVVELLLKTALSAERLDTIEHKTEIEHLDREQAIALLEEKLTHGPAAAILRARLLARQNGQVIEGSASEVVALRR